MCERRRRARRIVPAALALFFLLPAATTPARAQDPNLVDQGRFDVRIGDRVVGTETFAIRRQGDGYMAVGRIQLEGSGAWLRSAEVMLRTDGSFSPLRYRYESRASDDPQSLNFARTGTRIRVTTSNREGERVTELLADPSQVLLDAGIAQHYYFVVRRLSAGGATGATAVIPAEGREATIDVAATSDVGVRIGDRDVEATRWELSIAGAAHHVWVARDDGRVLRVEIPSRDFRSVRLGEGDGGPGA
ncbi:MAG: hypothetical protein ACODAA_02045 [Gemmatimonadota bacterium]